MTDAELEQQDRDLRREADDLLERYGLLEILGRVGRPHLSGSYALRLMTWRDLDIYLEIERPDVAAFLDMARDIGRALHPRKLSYTDQLNFPSTEPLSGLYLGMQTRPLASGGWKLDVWGVTPDVCAERLGYLASLDARLTADKRRAALAIKSVVCRRPEYRKSVTSQDVYDAVLSGVTTVEAFDHRPRV